MNLFLNFSVLIITSTSKPVPLTFIKGLSFAIAASTGRTWPYSAASSAASGSVGRPTALAKSLPVPKGSIPISVSEPISAAATSFAVPSPPTDITRWQPFLEASSANSLAWPLPVVYRHSKLLPLLSIWGSSSSKSFLDLPEPDTGFTIKKRSHIVTSLLPLCLCRSHILLHQHLYGARYYFIPYRHTGAQFAIVVY